MNSIFKVIKKQIHNVLKQNRTNDYTNLNDKSIVEIFCALRHETHRLEKAYYNNQHGTKKIEYHNKLLKIISIQDLIQEKYPEETKSPVYLWSKNISNSYPDIEKNFIHKYGKNPKKIELSKGEDIISLLKNRRSCRLWTDTLNRDEIQSIIPNLVEAAKWAPNSGNRQAVRLKPIIDDKEKKLLVGIKEAHCYSAPLLMFIGVDTRLYGALSYFEESMYLDAAAAITQMVIYIESIGLGSSWNHFGLDMIKSRPSNVSIYNRFISELAIPSYIMPIAILAIGKPKLITPEPERMPDNFFLI